MRQHGFSLLELSIVLVIIGLIAGGIVAGSSMIRAAEMRSVMTDLERYKAASYTFRDKYFSYPGDIKNATAFWGTDVANGNGNGIVEEAGVGAPEPTQAWEHFSLSGMIAGNFDGNYAASGDYRVGENVPEAFSGSFYNYVSEGASTIYGEPPLSHNTMRIQGVNFSSYLTAPEAWSIDKKIDDGIPDTGSIIGFGGVNTTPSPSIYLLDTDDVNSYVWFYLD